MNLFLAIYKRQHPDREKCTGGEQHGYGTARTCTNVLERADRARPLLDTATAAATARLCVIDQ
eukprot:gene16052-biopygen8220